MKHYRLNNQQRAAFGGFTDMWILGITRNAGSTDFTDADTAQAITLETLAIGDIVFGDVVIDTYQNFDGPSLSAATASVGVTGTVTALTAASNVLAAGSEYFASGAAVAHYVATAAIALIADLTTTGCNLNALTAGEIRIWARISRKKDRVTDLIG